MALFSGLRLYFMCWENYTKAHVYIHDIIQPIPETFRAQGMQVGKRAPQTSH